MGTPPTQVRLLTGALNGDRSVVERIVDGPSGYTGRRAWLCNSADRYACLEAVPPRGTPWGPDLPDIVALSRSAEPFEGTNTLVRVEYGAADSGSLDPIDPPPTVVGTARTELIASTVQVQVRADIDGNLIPGDQAVSVYVPALGYRVTSFARPAQVVAISNAWEQASGTINQQAVLLPNFLGGGSGLNVPAGTLLCRDLPTSLYGEDDEGPIIQVQANFEVRLPRPGQSNGWLARWIQVDDEGEETSGDATVYAQTIFGNLWVT